MYDRKPSPKRAWKKLTIKECDDIIELELEMPELSPRKLAVSSTDNGRAFKAQDLITIPAYILMQASDKLQNPAQRVNEMRQTDFTYFKTLSWGSYYLSTILDDYSRIIVAWRLCTSMSGRSWGNGFSSESIPAASTARLKAINW